MGYVEQIMGTNEKVLAVNRQHFWVWVPRAIISVLLFVVISGLSAFAANRTQQNGFLLIILLNILVIWWFLSRFLNWWNEEYIITNRRIIQTEGVFNKNVSDSSLEKINDVKLTQSVMGRLLNFGDLDILTASEQGINHLHFIQDPVKFKVAMLNAKEGLHDVDDFNVQNSAGPATLNDIPKLIEQLQSLKDRGLITDQEFEEKRKKLLAQI